MTFYRPAATAQHPQNARKNGFVFMKWMLFMKSIASFLSIWSTWKSKLSYDLKLLYTTNKANDSEPDMHGHHLSYIKKLFITIYLWPSLIRT